MSTLHEHRTVTVTCPACQKDSGHRIDHLFTGKLWQTFGPWSCKACGAEFTGTVNDLNQVQVQATGKRDQRGVMLVRVHGTDVYFALNAMIYEGQTDEDRTYFVEEHTCPANLTRFPILEIQKDREMVHYLNADPHGLLEFVELVPEPEGWDRTFGARSDEAYVQMFDTLYQELRARNSKVLNTTKILS